MSDRALRVALSNAARQAERHARRHDTPWAHALSDRLRDAARIGEVPDRDWLAAAIRQAADDPDDDTLALLAALGAVVRAAPRQPG